MAERASFWDTPITYGQVLVFYLVSIFLDAAKSVFGMWVAAVVGLICCIVVTWLERRGKRRLPRRAPLSPSTGRPPMANLSKIASAVGWIVIPLFGVPIAVLAFLRMPEALQISASILLAGGAIAAAVWAKESQHVVTIKCDNIDGMDLRGVGERVYLVAPNAKTVAVNHTERREAANG